MITHVVLIRAVVDDPAMDAILGEIAGLRGSLDGLRSVVHGRSRSPEHIERGFMHGMVLTFDDWQALHRYAVDPRHVATAQKIRAAAAPDGVLVFDLDDADARTG